MKRLEYHPQVVNDPRIVRHRPGIQKFPETDDFVKFRELLIRKVANAMSLPAGSYIDIEKDRR